MLAMSVLTANKHNKKYRQKSRDLAKWSRNRQFLHHHQNNKTNLKYCYRETHIARSIRKLAKHSLVAEVTLSLVKIKKNGRLLWNLCKVLQMLWKDSVRHYAGNLL